ncbi:MAG: hypothetical protein HQ564_03830 [Candidatus Saganbacteria bacterium]|nr:hypothetical protein [Candidatus Saganbacteria bacterium]
MERKIIDYELPGIFSISGRRPSWGQCTGGDEPGGLWDCANGTMANEACEAYGLNADGPCCDGNTPTGGSCDVGGSPAYECSDGTTGVLLVCGAGGDVS